MSELNGGHYFEAMDRCNTLMIMIDEILDKQPTIVEEGLQKDIDDVVSTLVKCYQKLGEKDETWE